MAAYREIDLCPEVAELLRQDIGSRRGWLFPSERGSTPKTYTAIRRLSLHPKLVKLGLYSEWTGFHCYRRFRSAQLRAQGCPEDLRKYWLGHENDDVSDHYAEQLLADRSRRREWAGKVGLRFEVPSPYNRHYSNQIVNTQPHNKPPVIN